MTAVHLDKSAQSIRGMFAGVAPRYDRLNHLLSGSLDRLWRRRSATAVASAPDGPVLDLCCGTGDQAVTLERLTHRQVVAADFCLPMVALGRPKFVLAKGHPPMPLVADALALPLLQERFAAVTVSFGIRNLADLDRGLGQMRDALKPGGRVVILEFALPRWFGVRQIYSLYLRLILPILGKVFSSSGPAYAYLRDSVMQFPQRSEIVGRMENAGLVDAGWKDLSLGTVCLYQATRPEETATVATFEGLESPGAKR